VEISVDSYRDDDGKVVDDLDIAGSKIESVSVTQNSDGKLNLTGKTIHGKDFERNFEINPRNYTGLIPIKKEPIQSLNSDLKSILAILGFVVESAEVDIQTNNSEQNHNKHTLTESQISQEVKKEIASSASKRGDIKMDDFEDASLPLTALTQSKNHRELLDYFLSANIPDKGYNKTDISEESGVSANGIRRHIDVFLEFGIVKETTSDDARITRYTNDPESEIHRTLRIANNMLKEQYLTDK